jgi:hypothetical protein
MEFHKSKQQVALEAGFSESTARVPKSIEIKLGFKLAVAQLAGEVENTSMKLLFELQARDLSKMSNKDLLLSLSTMTKVIERLSSRLPSV